MEPPKEATKATHLTSGTLVQGGPRYYLMKHFFKKKQYLVWKNKSRHFQTENTKSTPEAFDLLFVAPSAGYTNGKEQQNE